MFEAKPLEQRLAKHLRKLAEGLEAGTLIVGTSGWFCRGIFTPILQGRGQKLVGRRWILPLMFAHKQTEGADTHV